MDLEDIMVSEYVCHRRTNSSWLHCCEISKIVKLIEAENKMVVARGWREEKMGSCSSAGMEFLFHKMKIRRRSVAQQCEYI